MIGVSEYKYPDAGLRDLDFADDDARAMADFLKSPAGGKFADTDIRLLLNQDASINAVKSALEQIAKLARPEDMVVIFIAGHGAPDPVSPQNLYFLLNDTKVVDMKGTAFPMNELRLYLDTKLAAKRVLTLIDTCHSAGINQGSKELVSGRDLVRVGDENNISNFYLAKQLFKESGRAVLTSSDVNEVSQESAKWNNHGVFSWALLEGLRGKADFNRDDDLIQAGMIGLLEAAANFAADRGASFETYAGIRIRGAMLDALRKLDWAPRSVHRRAREVATAGRELEHELGREARDVEIAERMRLPLEEYHYRSGRTRRTARSRASTT